MLHKYNIPPQPSKDILDAIFGKKLGSTYMEGLVDAAEGVEFQEKLDRALVEWRHGTTYLSWY